MWVGGLGAEGQFDYFLGCLGFLGFLALAYERVGGILLSKVALAAVGLFMGARSKRGVFWEWERVERGFYNEELFVRRGLVRMNLWLCIYLSRCVEAG